MTSRLRRRALPAFLLLVLVTALPAAQGSHAQDSEALARAGKEIDALAMAGHFDEAERRARDLLAQAESGKAEEKAQSLGILVEVLVRAGKAAQPEAGDLAARAVALLEGRTGSSEDLPLARALYRVGTVQRNRGEYGKALETFERSAAMAERVAGADSLDAAKSLFGKAAALTQLSGAAEAIPLLQRVLAIQTAALGEEHPDVARTLTLLGSAQRHTGDYNTARGTYEKALELVTRLYGDRHPEVGRCLNNLANVLRETGDLERARDDLERALDILETAYGPEHPVVASVLHSLFIVLVDIGDYAGARPLEERALALDIKTQGPKHPSVADDLAGLAELLALEGDLEAALDRYSESLDLAREVLGPDHVFVAKALYGQAMVLRQMDQPARAEDLDRQVLAMWEKLYGPDNGYIARILNEIAQLRRQSGDAAEARDLDARALRIWEKSVGSDTPLAGSLRSELADILIDLGDLSQAQTLLDEALPLLARHFGEDSLPYAEALARQARLAWQRGEAGPAMTGSMQARGISRRRFQEAAAGLSEREALTFEAARLVTIDLPLSVLAEGKAGPGGTARIWDEIVRSRGMVLESIASRSRALAAPAAEGIAAARALSASRAAYATLLVRGPDPEDPGRYAQLLKQARERMERSEREAAAASGRAAEEGASAAPSLARVRAALPNDSVLVAYVSYKRIPALGKGTAVPSYGAFVAASKTAAPVFVPLGAAAAIDARIARWAEEAGRDPRRDPDGAVAAASRYRETATRLRQAVWDPVRARVHSRQAFIVPDGPMHLVSLATLADGPDSYLLETGPSFHYLTAERDLLRKARKRLAVADLLAIADPLYAAPLQAAGSLTADGSGTDDIPGTAVKSLRRGAGSSCEAFRRLTFEPLPASVEEAEHLRTRWSRRSGDDGRPPGSAIVLTGAQADEAAFKRLAAGRSVLHLATHGFFLNEGCPSGPIAAGESAANPLRLSGVALAGANHRNEVDPASGAEDGILTAEEISSLDLSAADWVVLSACRSGVGGVMAGEGALGMRRAFEAAGAATLIMSLWEIEDRAALAWMDALYDLRLAGRSTPECVQKASLRLLEDQRRRGATTHPYFWGGFVAAGDWR
jgi:CHAT domain-containing protein/tetratricopeptide (TPR) repeat protein